MSTKDHVMAGMRQSLPGLAKTASRALEKGMIRQAGASPWRDLREGGAPWMRGNCF